MYSGGVLGDQAETWKSKQKEPLATKSHNITGIQVKSCILEGFWDVRLKPGKVIAKNSHRLHSATKSHNITRIEVKSWILQGFWEISLKPEKVSKNSDSLQDHVKS